MNIHALDPSRFNELPLSIGPVENVCVVVAEDTEGVIKGMWSACYVVHIDPCWLSPDVRDGGRTGLSMLKELLSIVAGNGHAEFYGFTDRPETEGYARRLGLEEMPLKVWKGINPFVSDVLRKE